jgi:hypothetical protein
MHSYLDFFVLIYINDLLMFFSFIEKHIEHVKLMLQRLRQFRFYFKFNKCSFHVFHVNFLDFRTNFDEIAMQTNKIIVVKNWSKSKSHKNVQVFINFANFYKRFVHAFFKTSTELIFLFIKNEKKVQNQIRHDFKNEKIHEISIKNLHEHVDATLLWIRWRVDDENKCVTRCDVS